MKKIIFLLILFSLCFSLSSCSKGRATFKLDNAYYKISSTENKTIEDNDIIFKDRVIDQVVRLNVLFEFKAKSRNVNNLPNVKVNIVSITYVVKLDGKEILSTKVNSSTYQEDAVYNISEGNIHTIKETTSLRVPVLDTGNYEVTCYANYYLNDKTLTKPITFKFVVK
ncbi:MAG: hypothetical protein IJ966_02455 [Bacilli bacterium]|nr:hypothetical protein [Bacilli bacterium]